MVRAPKMVATVSIVAFVLCNQIICIILLFQCFSSTLEIWDFHKPQNQAGFQNPIKRVILKLQSSLKKLQDIDYITLLSNDIIIGHGRSMRGFLSGEKKPFLSRIGMSM